MTYLQNESGAVTVDWVVLTAGLVGLGLATMSVVSTGVQDTSGDIEAQLRADGIIQTGFSAAEVAQAAAPAPAAAPQDPLVLAAAADASQVLNPDGSYNPAFLSDYAAAYQSNCILNSFCTPPQNGTDWETHSQNQMLNWLSGLDEPTAQHWQGKFESWEVSHGNALADWDSAISLTDVANPDYEVMYQSLGFSSAGTLEAHVETFGTLQDARDAYYAKAVYYDYQVVASQQIGEANGYDMGG